MDKTQIPLDEALSRGRAKTERHGDLEYTRFTDDFRGVPRGTVVAGDRVVWGYPHIGRVLSLQAGLEQQFPGDFWLEEKIDGYNVRIARLGDRVVAFSRGGYACPFSNDRLPDLLDDQFFEAHPDLTICAEIAGPENPYVAATPPHVERDIALFVFDIMVDDKPAFLGVRGRQQMVDQFGLPAVAEFGCHTAADLDEILALLRRLHDQGSEGIVIKDDGDPQHRAKYVTGEASLQDIRVSGHELMDLPPDFYLDRVLRLGIYLLDQGRPLDRELREALGGAFLDGLLDTVRHWQTDRHMSRHYRCRFRSEVNAEAFMRHLEGAQGHEVQVLRRGLEWDPEDNSWVLDFERVAPRTTGLLGHLYGGGLLYDP